MVADLKLIALDAEDLAVMSAHLQDAVVRVEDIAFLPKERRFAMIMNRFDWSAGAADRKSYVRRRVAVRFEKVITAQTSNLDLTAKDNVLSLLALSFEVKDEPAGVVDLVFSGNSAIRLTIECVEAELRDLGAQWATTHKPAHPDEISQD